MEKNHTITGVVRFQVSRLYHSISYCCSVVPAVDHVASDVVIVVVLALCCIVVCHTLVVAKSWKYMYSAVTFH